MSPVTVDIEPMEATPRTEARLLDCCTAVTAAGITRDQAAVLAELFKALADPHRVLIVNLLATTSEPLCVCEFMPALGLSQGTVSFHLKKLRTAGLVEREQRGTWAYYSLNQDALARMGGVFETNGGTA